MDDGLRSIIKWRNKNGTGKLSADKRQRCPDAFRHFNCVRAGAAIDGQNHCCRWHRIPAPPELHPYTLALTRILDRSYTAQIKGRAARAPYDQIAVLFSSFQLT